MAFLEKLGLREKDALLVKLRARESRLGLDVEREGLFGAMIDVFIAWRGCEAQAGERASNLVQAVIDSVILQYIRVDVLSGRVFNR